MYVTLGYLAEHPEVLPTLAAWFESEWPLHYGAGGHGDAKHDLALYSNLGSVPVGIVAFHERACCGFAALKNWPCAASHNTALLRAVARLAPADIVIELYNDLGNLPLFNPDIEHTDPPSVANLRARILAADVLLIASPEYAHGITGVLKNALDWMVRCEAFVNKPVAVLNASPRAVIATASLKEITRVMSAIVVEEASISVPILGSGLDEDAIVAHPVISATIRDVLQALHTAFLQLPSENTHQDFR